MTIKMINRCSVSLIGPIISAFFMNLTGCSSKPIIMTSHDVVVSRADVPKKCQEMGRVTGTTTSIHGTSENALEDMKTEASRKGANFVKIGQFSDTGTTVTGTAYNCP